eukprot:3874749-Pleurochrysis_carterae.AAC.1
MRVLRLLKLFRLVRSTRLITRAERYTDIDYGRESRTYCYYSVRHVCIVWAKIRLRSRVCAV